jgi:hypothetical protein
MSERRNITQPADWWAALKTQTPATTGVFSCAHHLPTTTHHNPPIPGKNHPGFFMRTPLHCTPCVQSP